MGDGGVACMYNVMDRFPVPDNTSAQLKPLKKKKKKKQLKKPPPSSAPKEPPATANADDVEEGELGSLAEPAPEIVEAGEFIPGKWRRPDFDFRGVGGGGGGHRDEIEKGEFVPDRWPRDDYGYVKMRRSWKWERERTPPAQPPPSGKYSSPCEDGLRRKEFNRGVKGNANPRWECGPERNVRISSKIVDEEGLLKKDFNNTGRSYGKDHSSGNRLKRFGAETDTTERKHYGDYADFGGPKSRRLSDERLDGGRAEHYSRPSVERSYRTPATRVPLTDKYLGRNYDSALPSRTVYERHARSPVPMERSPRDRNRYYDHRERSPVRRERSPFVRDRSPYGRERSPFVRDRSPYGRERSPPYGRERSPFIRDRSPYGRERSPPYGRERSPYDRSRPYDHKNRSQSPPDRSRHNDRRDRTPSYLEKSPHDRNRPINHRETGKKSGPSEKRSAQSVTKEQEDKPAESLKEPAVKDSSSSAKESPDKSTVVETSASEETNVNCDIEKEEAVQSPGTSCKETAEVDVTVVEEQELPSMEEDMDICDTPPHVTVVSDLSTGKWFYLDYYGVECGPSKLCDLKTLMEEGALMTDHMIKHADSDRWMTVENAASPLVTLNFPSILPDSITQLVNPPEAPGNLLVDNAEFTEEKSALRSDSGEAVLELLEELQIDERVEAMLEGISVVPGKELETVGDVLQMTFECAWEWVKSEGLASHPGGISVQDEQMSDEPSTHSDVAEGVESLSSVPSDKDHGAHCDSGDWFSGRWSCKGGDWMRNDEATTQERSTRKKLVLNDGFPLCQMPKSGYEDPRWHRKDDLYYPSQGRRLDLPHWGFSIQDDKSDSSSVSRLAQSKAPVVRGAKGTMLPVVRINTCVVKDHGSFVSESRMKARGKDRHSSRTIRSHSIGSDGKRSSVEGDSQSRITTDCDFQGSWKYGTSVNKPRDRICTVDELQLNFGEWYYLDGTGHEQGPSSFSELQALADQGIIPRRSSVFRKLDRVWVPITSSVDSSDQTVKCTQENTAISGDYSASLLQSDGTSDGKPNTVSTVFNNLHPQFIGYTLGKLHELVMKSYKSREFAAAINEVLDPWINARQPKKDIEKHIFWKTEGDVRAAKRARFLTEDSEDDNDTEDNERIAQSTFEELCSEATFCREETLSSESGWGSLDGHVLARVFHFLKADMKSLTFASLTCKHWRATVRFYRDISRQIDFSCFGPECVDSMVLNIANDYKKDKISAMVLRSCINITSSALEEILFSFPCLSNIDIRGCSQFNELTQKFPSVNWIKNRNLRGALNLEDSHSKIRSLRHITEKSSSISRVKGPYAGDMDDFGELKQYFDSVNKRDSANQLFRRSLYKRSKLFDARKSSSILSRDARTRRWAFKKSENGYKRMEEFLASSLKDIMKENTFDFFVPKVAEIQDKMKKGYYIGRGLNSVKEDISRMCRDAIKAKKRGDTGNMNRMVTLFIQLASRLEAGSTKFSHEKDVLKLYEDDSSSGFSSTSKYKKKLNKVVPERKYRSNGTSSLNGGLDYGEDASDREIRRRLSKLNKRSFDSESDTSDDADRSFEDSKSVSESTISDTESEKSESQTWQSRVNGDIIPEASLESMTDDREWGARMTKASLVPPVTRKYEVIDRYVVVADEDEVRRKMQVSLPDDYVEKLSAQKNGIEESDMELPEVKDYKPRKQPGSEVLEQEVYGIDPYTHNLLLDSMPEEMDCPLLEKHVFIEEVLLRTLNKKVRNFTGTGNTPMVYPLQPVIEEIQDCAEDDDDFRTVRICQSLLRAIDSRTDDKYVAYRKGLGVVCNKEAGFAEEDFVVEFLGEVYPVWKWFEKQDGIRSLQKNSDDPAPEFYNIYLERPKGDADGYDLVVVDAMHKANYASRICHSCRPNCEAKVTAVDGHYQIGIYSVRKISHGEEITFDYNSVTESKEEYEASVCLCGSQVCRGSYLNLTGEGAFQKVLKDWHGVLDCHQLMLEACETNSVSEEDYLVLGRAGLGSCLLGGLPDWLIAYSAHLVRFINFERTKLPDEILKHNLEEKRKYFSEICLEVETSDAEVQAEGVYNQRLQNLAVTLDKVRYVMRCIFGDPKLAPPPLERMSPEAAVTFLWKGEGSLVEELVECLMPHVDEKVLDDLKSKISAHDPSSSQDIQKELKKSLLWLRDEVQNLPCSSKSRNDAAADLIHIYAYTKSFFRIREYKAVTSPPVYISPLDLGPKYKDKLGSSGLQEYCKTYGENYCLGQLIFWHNQTNADPDCSLASASRGCLSLPELCSFYAMIHKPSRQRVYGPKTVRFLLTRMEKVAQKAWPRDRIWSFKSSPKVIGSPMLDAVLGNTPLDKEMVHWLKHRPTIYQAMWDR